jgi:hypothetical protein
VIFLALANNRPLYFFASMMDFGSSNELQPQHFGSKKFYHIPLTAYFIELCSSETLVSIYQTTQYNIPEDKTSSYSSGQPLC